MIGQGKVFYVTPALYLANALGNALDSSRPVPASQIGNFGVIFVMAGFLYLPALLRACGLVLGRSYHFRLPTRG